METLCVPMNVYLCMRYIKQVDPANEPHAPSTTHSIVVRISFYGIHGSSLQLLLCDSRLLVAMARATAILMCSLRNNVVRALSKLHGVPSFSSASDVLMIKYLYINLRAEDRKGALWIRSNRV